MLIYNYLHLRIQSFARLYVFEVGKIDFLDTYNSRFRYISGIE